MGGDIASASAFVLRFKHNTVAEVDPIGGVGQDPPIQTSPWLEDQKHQKRTEQFDQ